MKKERERERAGACDANDSHSLRHRQKRRRGWRWCETCMICFRPLNVCRECPMRWIGSRWERCKLNCSETRSVFERVGQQGPSRSEFSDRRCCCKTAPWWRIVGEPVTVFRCHVFARRRESQTSWGPTRRCHRRSLSEITRHLLSLWVTGSQLLGGFQ